MQARIASRQEPGGAAVRVRLNAVKITTLRFSKLWGVSPHTVYQWSRTARPVKPQGWFAVAADVMEKFPEVRRYLEERAGL